LPDPYQFCFLDGWEKKVSADDALAKQTHALTALKSLTLSGVLFDNASLKSLVRVIDIMGLQELTLNYLTKDAHFFFQHLANLATSAQKSPTSIGLRSLCLDMGGNYLLGQRQADFDAKCLFISSFDTLTTMELKDCNLYPGGFSTNSRLPDVLVQAILKHNNLKTPKLSYYGIASKVKVPYLSARTVAAMVDALPRLEYFHFALDETQIVWHFQLFYTLIRIKHAK
jgi:hypothetical protein